jgi:integrase
VSVYKDPKSPFYRYDFQLNGHRFSGSTKARNKKEAEVVERQIKAKTKADLELAKIEGDGPLLLRHATGRYMAEVGDHHANARTTFTDLERLIGFFGPDKRLDEITNDDVTKLVAWRRSHTIMGRKKDKDGNPAKLVSAATVNRSTTILLRAVFSRAKDYWDRRFPREPKWGRHILEEPDERVRELDAHEAQALDDAFAGKHERTNKHQRKNHRTDYELWFRFARITALRRNETLIRWQNVIWYVKPVVKGNVTIYGRIETIGKGDRKVNTPITPAVKNVLDQCKGDHEEYVFTYVCQRPLEGQKRGTRYPITPEGAKSQWRRAKARAKVENFRFHDIRHDVGTKALRLTGNLKLVQKLLNHSDIKTTVKYAHVVDDEVAAALYEISTPTEIPTTDMKKAG